MKGACYYARLKYGGREIRGYDFLVDSTIPPSGGASSSSALVVLAGAAIREANRINFTSLNCTRFGEGRMVCRDARRRAMDHLAICLAEHAHVVRISYGRGARAPVPLPGGTFRWVPFFSHPADKGREIMLEYNERAAIARVLSRQLSKVEARLPATSRRVGERGRVAGFRLAGRVG